MEEIETYNNITFFDKLNTMIDFINSNDQHNTSLDNFPSTNWKSFFKEILLRLRIEFTINSESDLKLNCFLFLHKLVSKLGHSDFEIKILFNEIVTDLIPFLNDHNVRI